MEGRGVNLPACLAASGERAKREGGPLQTTAGLLHCRVYSQETAGKLTHEAPAESLRDASVCVKCKKNK